MTRLTKAQLRLKGIHNPHDIAEGQTEPRVFIFYYPQQLGRAYRNAAWRVHHVGYKTDPTGHWTDNGNKTFNVNQRTEKEPQRLEALRWATTRYGISEWERSPFGSYHPLGTMARLAKVQEVSQ